jgi:hypothetical protein
MMSVWGSTVELLFKKPQQERMMSIDFKEIHDVGERSYKMINMHFCMRNMFYFQAEGLTL